jgi:hypothetical protein
VFHEIDCGHALSAYFLFTVVALRYPGIGNIEELATSLGLGLSSCVRAMQASGNNVDVAADWLLTNMDEEQTKAEEVGRRVVPLLTRWALRLTRDCFSLSCRRCAALCRRSASRSSAKRRWSRRRRSTRPR